MIHLKYRTNLKNEQDGVELVGFADKSFAVTYFSSPASRSVGVILDSSNRITGSSTIYITEVNSYIFVAKRIFC